MWGYCREYNAPVQLPSGATDIVMPNLVGAIGMLVLSFSTGIVVLVGMNQEAAPSLTFLQGSGSNLSVTATPGSGAMGLNISGSQLQIIAGAAYTCSYDAQWFGFGVLPNTYTPVGPAF